MRILALITETGTKGGVQRFNQAFLSALSSSHSVTILPRAQSKNKICYILSVLLALRGGRKFDLIFCGHLFLAPLAALLSRLRNVPYWLQLHGIEVFERPSLLLRWAVGKASLVTTVSRYTRQRFLSWTGVSPEKVRVLPNAVSQSFRPGPKPEYLLKRYGLLEKKIIFTLSRLSSRERYKGQDRVLAILPRLLEKEENLVYVIGGEGEDRRRLEVLAKKWRLNGAVRFIGLVPESELADHYRLADIFVMPSTGEGFGIVFLEAAACGIPVIGGNRDGSVDAVLEGKLGRLVDPENSDQLLQGILECLKEDHGNPQAVLKFSEENFASHVKALLQEINSWS